MLQLGRQLFRVGVERGVVLIQRRQIPAVGLAVGGGGEGGGEGKSEGQQGQHGAFERGCRHTVSIHGLVARDAGTGVAADTELTAAGG
ncbi:hypothetical protein D3C72_2150520 [compost metagenome]